jgi:hypothetical protein
MNLKLIIKIVGGVVLILALGLAEEGIRSTQREDMPVHGLPLPDVQITAMQQPDFLWAGKAWWINVETRVPLVIHLDDWKGEVPPGRHRIFSNHDYTNTGNYGNAPFWGKPREASVSLASIK